MAVEEHQQESMALPVPPAKPDQGIKNRLSFLALLMFALLVVQVLSLDLFRNRAWEYRHVYAMARTGISTPTPSRTGPDAITNTVIDVPYGEFERMGLEGWELAGSYLETETAYPNFGDAQYVTGLQPNVRPFRAVFLFKRARPLLWGWTPQEPPKQQLMLEVPYVNGARAWTKNGR